MEPTTQNNTLRSLLIFSIIGAILLAAVILGVRWARGRSDQLANANQQQTQQPASDKQDQNKSEEQKPPQPQNQNNQVAANNNSSSQTSSSSTSQPTPARVPSTGVSDAFLSIAALAAFVFAVIRYLQSRRQLTSLR